MYYETVSVTENCSKKLKEANNIMEISTMRSDGNPSARRKMKAANSVLAAGDMNVYSFNKFILLLIVMFYKCNDFLQF